MWQSIGVHLSMVSRYNYQLKQCKYLVKIYLLKCEFWCMCLYLFNNAHTGTTTSDLKISKNIMVKLNCYINVTKHCVQHKSMETCWYSYQFKTMYLVNKYLWLSKFWCMCLYLFNKAHTSTTTSDLKNSKNIMVTKLLY